MPNTLAHLGIQGLLTHAAMKDADPKWVALGCLIPDLPWILQRGLGEIFSTIDAYELRLYVIAQASLLVCVLFCAAAALFSKSPSKIFRLLVSNVLLHLILDACQIKWANGVHLIAPLSWKLLNFGWFWPESLLTVALTATGLLYAIWALRQGSPTEAVPLSPPLWRIGLAIGFLTAYLLVPILMRHGPYELDNHYVQTLRNHPERIGRQVEMDRRPYQPQKTMATVVSLVGERINLSSQPLSHPATISLRATFIDAKTLRIDALHLHWPWFRDGASYLGLLLLCALWLKSGYQDDYRPTRNRL